jgi:hypothetical protein
MGEAATLKTLQCPFELRFARFLTAIKLLYGKPQENFRKKQLR